MLAIEWAPQAVVASTPVRPRRITPAHHWRVANSEHSAQLELPRRVGGSRVPRGPSRSGVEPAPGPGHGGGPAATLMVVHRTLVDYVRTQVLAGRRGSKLVEDFRSQARRAFRRLEQGLGDYAVKASVTKRLERGQRDRPLSYSECGQLGRFRQKLVPQTLRQLET